MTAVNELNEIIDICNKFSLKEVSGGVLEADMEAKVDWVNALWAKSLEIGLPGLIVPEAFNGVGQSELCCALVLDVLASECAGLASVYAHHFSGCLPIGVGSQSQKDKYFIALANADVNKPAIATVIFPDDTAQDPLRLEERKGQLILNGTSPPVGNAEYAKYVCLFVEEDEKGDAITCLMLDRNAPGFSIGESSELPGLKVNPFAALVFQDVEIGFDAILGERSKSRTLMENTKNLFFSFIAAMAMGAARRACQKARTYAEERFQYGKIIINHQEIQRMLGNMLEKLSIGTAGYSSLFNKKELHLSYSVPEASLVKAFCADAALEIAIDAIQIHGGYGYMHEYGVEKIMRDCKVLQLIGGSSPVQHINAITANV